MSKKHKQKIQAGQAVPTTGGIPKAQLPDDHILFSLRYHDNTNCKFGLNECEADYFREIIGRLISVCQMNERQFRQPFGNSKSLRSHFLDFKKTSEQNGFGFSNLIWNGKQWQFSISKTHGRIHGFLEGNVFHIVWFDPKHNLYPWND